MIKILDGYIGKTIVTTSALCLLVLTGLSSMLRFVDQLRKVGRGTYEILDALIFVMFSVPRDVELFFPMAVLLGSLIGLGMMASNRELVVMQASGWSRFDVAVSVMKTAIPLMLVVMALGEWGAPISERTAREFRANKISGGSLIKSSRGVWAKDGSDFVNIGEVIDGGTLNDLNIYEFDSNLQLSKVVHADTARFQGGGWRLMGVTETYFMTQRVTLEQQPEALWNTYLTPDKLSVVSLKPEALSIQGLWEYIAYLKNGRQDTVRYELAMWRKIFQPLTVAVMMMLALSFVFGPLRSVTMGARILLGIITGFGFYLAEQVFGPVALVFKMPPVLGALLPPVIFSAIAYALLQRR
jgi:lipopolysaccharide export system permease protein